MLLPATDADQFMRPLQCGFSDQRVPNAEKVRPRESNGRSTRATADENGHYCLLSALFRFTRPRRSAPTESCI
jgi:hypothetical protein